MNILQIAPQLPYPLSDGGKVGIYNITRHLAERGHSMTIVCFNDGTDEVPAALSAYAEVIRVRHNTGNSVWTAALNLFNGLPYNISKYQSRSMVSTLQRLMEQKTFDAVHIDHLHMAGYGVMLRAKYGVPIVLREHNIESTIVERYKDHTKNPVKRVYLEVQLRRIERYESAITKEFDHCAVITNEDERRLLKMQPKASTAVVPGGVEKRYFEGPFPTPSQTPTIIFFGGFDWLPNQDALRWFINDIMPGLVARVPHIELQVIGKNVPPDLQRPTLKNIVFRGFVDDLKTAVQAGSVVIAPIRIGGGIRLKILESFAMRVPVVSTTVGCEGIECRHGREIMIADDPSAFIEACVQLIGSPDLRQTLAENAYRVATEHYSWEGIAQKLERLYLDGNRNRHD